VFNGLVLRPTTTRVRVRELGGGGVPGGVLGEKKGRLKSLSLVILVVAWLAIAAAQRAIRARFEVAPLKQWNVRREYLRRLKSAFDRAGIEVPFPQPIRRQPRCPGS